MATHPFGFFSVIKKKVASNILVRVCQLQMIGMPSAAANHFAKTKLKKKIVKQKGPIKKLHLYICSSLKFLLSLLHTS